MIKRFHANQARLQRHQRMRNRLSGTPIHPRLNVFRSGHHIYAQIIDDTTGNTLAAASSLDEGLRDFKPAQEQPRVTEKVGDAPQQGGNKAAAVDLATETPPTKGKGAKAEKAPGKAPAKGAQPQKGGKPGQAQTKTLLPAAQKGVAKTPVEALAAIANNRKVATAREVGKLVAKRAKEKGVSRVVFDRGGYAYHGRIAALAEGAREAGLNF
jgi:ribosomal protein L18